LIFRIFDFIENEKPSSKDTIDSSSKIIPIDQQRKSNSLLTTEEMTDLEERFDKWMNNRSKKIVDDLFDGLKVHFNEYDEVLNNHLILGIFRSISFDITNAYTKNS